MRLAHLGQAELWVSDFEASRRFFTEIMGLTVTDEELGAVYLCAWQDWEHNTLSLRRAELVCDGSHELVHPTLR